MPTKKTQKQFINELRAKYGVQWDYDKVVYVNAKTPVIITCKEHGDFESTPDNLLLSRHKSAPCGKCAIKIAGEKKRMTVETFIKKARETVSADLDYSKVKFSNSQEKVIICCQIHGDFKIRPSVFLYRANGCPKCSTERRDNAKRLTKKVFKERIFSIHGEKYSYDFTEYKSRQSKLNVHCDMHGHFTVTASNFLSGRGCPTCSRLASAKKRSLTTAEWVRKAKAVHGNTYDYSKTVYESAHKKVTIICSEHGEFTQRPSNHVSLKRGCASCSGIKKTTNNQNKVIPQDEFIARCLKQHKNSGLSFSKTKYMGMKKKVIVTCDVHGDFQISASNLQNGSGCSKCGNERVSEKRRIPKSKFIKTSSSHYDLNYDYSQIEYKNLRDRVIISCPLHGAWEVIAANHYYGNSGCPTCSKHQSFERMKSAITIDQDEFINICERIHGDKYDYSLTVYKGSLADITVICPSHGQFKQSARNHMVGKGCKKCALSIIAEKHTSESKDILQRFRQLHGERYKYNLPEKLKYTDHINIECVTHGSFRQQVRTHLQAKGCPKCSISKGENAISLWLDRHGYEHKVQYPINDSNSGKTLRFDFFIESENILIEYDGQQHYFPVNFGGMSDEKALAVHNQIKVRDGIKNEWAKKHGIKLIRIKFSDDVEEVLEKYLSPLSNH